MGNPFKTPKAPPPDPELELKLKQEREAAEAEAAASKLEEKQIASKKAKGLIGTRSLFGRAGGRGYFETVG